jgi:hypothetical protein
MLPRTLLLILLTLLVPQFASAGEDRCAAIKDAATAHYARCTNLPRRWTASWNTLQARTNRCTARLERAFTRADKYGGCPLTGGANEMAAFMDDVRTSYQDTNLSGVPLPIVIEPACDPSQANLLDYEAWRREEGYWIGEYTFLGADGDPNQSTSWPYRYDHYRGFIHLAVEGNAIAQRNVFLYPPQDSSLCTGDPSEVKGNGTCGVHGNEKVFSADQSASDCKGSLAGGFSTIYGDANTFTTIIEPDRVLYEVIFATAPFGGNLMQSQLTKLPGNGTRVRTAQGFNVVTELASYASFYRETKVSEAEFWAQLEATRIEYNVLPEDECGWDGVTSGPSGISCAEHFGN